MPRADPPVAEKTLQADRQSELFRSELIQIINLKHAVAFWRKLFLRPKSCFFLLRDLGRFPLWRIRKGGERRVASAGGLKLGFSGPTILEAACRHRRSETDRRFSGAKRL